MSRRPITGADLAAAFVHFNGVATGADYGANYVDADQPDAAVIDGHFDLDAIAERLNDKATAPNFDEPPMLHDAAFDLYRFAVRVCEMAQFAGDDSEIFDDGRAAIAKAEQQ